MNIRQAHASDHEAIWEIFSKVIQTGDTYVFSPDTPKADLQKHWFAPKMQTFVAEEQGQVLGTYILKPNHIDRGSHIANAAYMVHPQAQGKGIGTQLCEHSLLLAKEGGFIGMQFNLVVSTNQAAVAIWKKFGFQVIGTTPNGFRHQILGLVDTYIMYKSLV